MIRYTTPILPLEVEGIDLTNNEDVYVTLVQKLEQKSVELTKSGSDLTVQYNAETDISTITFSLTQEETAAFDVNKRVDTQVNFINNAGVRDATDIATIPVMRNLLDNVINYGD